eukprot:152400_1
MVLILVLIIYFVIFNSSSSSRKPDILFIYHEQNRIYTMDHENNDIATNTAVQAICIDVTNNKFIYVGINGDDVLNDCISIDSASFKQIYFNGSMASNISILPGLTDSHAHLMLYGETFFTADLTEATSIEQVLDLIDDYIINNDDKINDGWVTGWGWNQEIWNDSNDESQLIEGLPTRWMLDERFPEYKLFLERIDGHSAWINTAALNAVPPFPNEMPDDGTAIRDRYGNFTGALIDYAMNWVYVYIPPWTMDEQIEMLEIALQECAQNGLTGVHDAGNPPYQIELFKTIIDEPDEHGFKFTLRVNAMILPDDWYSFESYTPEDYAHLKGNLYDDLLTVNTVKFLMDGALGSRGAALIDPYCDINSSNGSYGLLFFSPEMFYKNISIWHEAGYQIATHAIGDAANREVIQQYINLINDYNLSEDHRLRIEHAQIVNATVDIPLLCENNIIASMQPIGATSDMIFAEDRLCEYRLSGAYAWKTMLNYSIKAMPFGSDFPVDAINPFLGIYAAITRQNENGLPDGGWTPYNKVSRYEALKGYTYDAAYSAFQEDVVGTISNDKFADFIIIDRDIFEINEMEILDTNVIATYLGGSPVFINPEWQNIIDF